VRENRLPWQLTTVENLLMRFARLLWNRNHNIILQAIGPALRERLTLADVLEDLPANLSSLGFEHLAGLFSSNSLNHGVIAMPIRQSAYVYRIVRENKMRRALEIGRWRGGSTLLITMAMGPGGVLWSIDNGEKELRLSENVNRFDPEIEEVLRRVGLKAKLIVGDSKTINFQEDDLDLVFIDGDHTYDGVKSDFERFAPRLKVGGALVFDDAWPDRFFPSHTESVGRLIEEFMPSGKYKLVSRIDRLAHFEKVAF